MSFTRATFLGASVRGFTSSIGWNIGQASQLNVQLVEDPVNGDSFTATDADIGTPIFFSFGSFRFSGLLQKFDRTSDTGGNPTYDVICVDPREILDGAQVILGNYSGSTTPVKNLLNVYGYWESFGYGLSGANEAGIPWVRVRDGIKALVNTPNYTSFGGPLTYRGVKYSIDLSELPAPPAYYRVGGSLSIGLLELIAQICDDGGCDFFVELDGYAIKIRTVSRKNQPPLGTISALTTSGYGSSLVRSRSGLEARNEVTSAFLVGGEQTTLHMTDAIASFWGYSIAGNPILGSYGRLDLVNEEFLAYLGAPLTANGQQMILDMSAGNLGWLAPAGKNWPTFPFYLRVDNEIIKVTGRFGIAYVIERAQFGTTRAAHAAGSVMNLSWWSVYCDQMNLNCAEISDILGTTSYPCSTLEMRLARAGWQSWAAYMAHFRRDIADRIGLTSPIKNALGPGAALRLNLVNDDRANALRLGQAAILGDIWARQMRAYEFVKKYADEYMGRKFAIGLPFLLSKQDSETLRITHSYDLTDGGYLPEGSAPLGLSPLNEDIFRTPDGRFRSFCVFDDLTDADLSPISPQGTVIEDGSLYMECQVEPGIIFTPTPAAVLTLQTSITDEPVDAVGDITILSAVLQMLPGQGQQVLERAQFGNVGVRIAPDYRTPYAVAVPLRSNTLTYGPWYQAGPPGKVRFMQDPSMTPWNFGGHANMNQAGLAQVAEAVTSMQVSEAGSLELTGPPTASLGDTLQAGGPNVTNIQVSFGTNGVTTSYSFQTYSPRFGTFTKGYTDRLKRLSLTAVELRRALRASVREGVFTKQAVSNARLARKWFENAPQAVRRESPHDAIISYSLRDTEPSSRVAPGQEGSPTNDIRVGVSTATMEEALAFCGAESDSRWQATAVMSWSGLFRPFCTQQGGGVAMPSYTTPAAGFTSVPLSQSSLDPWKASNDIEVYSWASSYEGLHAYRRGATGANARVLGLRGPLVVSGWGYDTDGNPVPGSGGLFSDGYLKRSDSWKTGPVDLVWDERRGVWTSHDIVHGVVSSSIGGDSNGPVTVYNSSTATSWTLQARNWGSANLSPGDRVVCAFDLVDGVWNILPASAGSSTSGVVSLPSGDPYTVLHTSGDGTQIWAKDPWIRSLTLGGSDAGGNGSVDIRAGVSYGHRLTNSLDLMAHRTWRLPADVPATGETLVCKTWDGTTAELEWAPVPTGGITYISASGTTLPTGIPFSVLYFGSGDSYEWSQTPWIRGLTLGGSEASGDGYVDIRAGVSYGHKLTNSLDLQYHRTWRLPADAPATGEVLTCKTWDGSIAELEWAPASGGTTFSLPTGSAYSLFHLPGVGSYEWSQTPTVRTLTLGGSGPAYTGSLKLAHASSGSVTHTTPARSTDLIIVWPSYDPAVGDIPRVAMFDSGSRTAYLDWVSGTGCICLETSSGTPPPPSPGASGDPCPETPPTLPETEPFISYNSLQLRADNMGVTPGGNGSEAHTWYDISVAANDASQGTSANRPIYYTNQVNGLDAVEFDGTDDYMTFGLPLDVSNGGFTCLMVLKQTASGYVIGGNTNGLEIGSGGNFHKVGVTYIGGPGASPPNDTWVCVGCRYDTTTGDWLARDYQGNDTSGSNLQTLSITNSYIGASVGAAVPAHFSGQVAEIVFCNGPISNAEFDAVWNYLVCKYALGNLYKTP